MPPNTNCPRCGSQYDTDKDRDRHVSNTRFCNDCQKCYASSQQANHFRTHQTSATISVHGQKLVIERSTPADRWACPLCPADAPCSYTETSNLTRHLRTRHDAAPTPHHAAAEQNPDSELDIGAFILQAERNARAKQQELADLVIATDNTADNNPWLDRSRALHILEGCRLPALARQGEGVKAAPIVVTLRTAVNDLWRWGVAAYQGMGADEEGGPMPGLSGHSFDRIMRSGASDAPPGGSTFMPRNPLNYAVYLRLLVSTLGADRVQRESGQPSGSSVTAPARSFDPCFTDAQQLAFDALFLQAQEPLPSSADSVTDEDKPKASQLALRLIDFVVSLIEEPLPSVPDRSALVRCTALMSINQSRGCYYDGPAVSSRLAGWVWCLRFCWILKQLYMHRHRASADWLAVIDTIAASRKRVLVDLTPYPMSVILSQEAYAIKLAWNSTGRAHFTWAADGQSLTFRGTDTLTMTHMRDFVHEQIDSTHRWLAEKLFLCTPEELPPSRRRDIKDNLYFEGAGGGYSFVTEPANAELWDKMWIVRRMRTASELQHRYVSTEHDSGWNILSLSDWLRKAQDGLEQLAVLLLWTGGQAPRGTELVTVRTSNTVIGARDLYVRDGQVFYTTAYNKSQRRTGNRMVIPRALPDAVGELVILWMVYVRSAQQVFHLAQNNTAMSVTLFADGQHRSWTFRKLSEAVSRITSDALGIQLHYHDLRQMFVFIANRHLRAKPDKHANSVLQSLDLEDREDGEDEGGEGRGSSRQEDAMHLQAGHSGRTGRMHYGLDVDQLRALSNEAVEVMWSVSRQRPSPLIVMLIAAMCVNSAVSAEWHTFLNLATRIEIGVVAPWDTVGRTTVQKRVLPVEESSSQQTGSETANEASFPSIKHRRIEIVPEPMFGQGLSATMMTSLISLYGTSYRARSPMQAAALGAIDCRATPLLVILGTGRGKSTLFLAQAKRTDAKTSVVVVPFVSLMQDLLRTCRSRGIHTEDFSSEMMGQPQLVLVSADRFFSPRFSEWWSHMASRQQLDWLFFDECHVLLTQSTFREQLQQFNGLFNLNIRLCLLTATLPPSLETVYRRRLALPAWTLLREETNRANLRYEVTLHADSKGVAGSVRETVKVFRSTVERRPAERCIIYVRDLKAGNALSKVLGVPVRSWFPCNALAR